jgi:PTS system mannose-specific IIA component
MVKVARSCGAPKSTREEFPMIGLVLVTHGRLADEFKAALEHVMGPQKQIEAITIGAEDDSDLCRSDIIEAVNRVDSGDGVAILTDMFGGTPSNLAMSFLGQQDVEVITGVNLPMLIKLAGMNEHETLLAVAREMREHGRNAIWVASDLLRGEKS